MPLNICAPEKVRKMVIADLPVWSASCCEFNGYKYLNKYFYTCEVGFLRCLADMWVADPRFAINYERICSGGVAFVRDCGAHLL